MLGQTGTRQSNQFLAIGHPEQHSSNRGKQIPSVFRLECGNTRWARCVFLTPAFTVESIWTQLKPFLRSCGCCNFLRSDAYIRSWSLSCFGSMQLRWLDSKLRTWKVLSPNVQRRRRWGMCILLCFLRHGWDEWLSYCWINMNIEQPSLPLSTFLLGVHWTQSCASPGKTAMAEIRHLNGIVQMREGGVAYCHIGVYLVFKKLQWKKGTVCIHWKYAARLNQPTTCLPASQNYVSEDQN